MEGSINKSLYLARESITFVGVFTLPKGAAEKTVNSASSERLHGNLFI